MRISKHLLLALLVALCWVGCGTTQSKIDSTAFTEIRIAFYPQGWGYAYKTVQADGSIVGGHASGGPENMRLFENKSRVTPEDMDVLRQLAANLPKRDRENDTPPPDQHVTGHITVTVAFKDGHAINAIAEWGKPFSSKTIQRIWDVVKPYAVGAW